jgi:hypothetical protein
MSASLDPYNRDLATEERLALHASGVPAPPPTNQRTRFL